MASEMNQHLTKVCLALFVVVVFASTAEAKFKDVNQFCRTSDYKQLCNVMVNGATNWHDATKNAVQSALKTATTLQTMTPQLEKALPPSKPDVLSTCKDTFGEAVDSLQQSLTLLDKNDIGGLNIHLSAVVGPSDCQDAFKEVGVAFPPTVAKVYDNMTKQVSNCLAVSEQI